MWHSFFASLEKIIMTTNLIDVIQQKLGYQPLQKIDPNIQETKEKFAQDTKGKLAQSAIPAVLTAFYKLLRTDDGCKRLISADPAEKWLGILYDGKQDEVVEKVSQYSGAPKEEAKENLENIAHEAAATIRELSGNPNQPEKIKTYMNGQRHNILVYLPAALNLGDQLNDESLDDRTNKMEGPISNFIHKIENKLSGGG